MSKKTKFMNTLYDKIMNRKKDRYDKNGDMYKTSKETAAKYIDYLRILNNGPFDDLEFLEDMKTIEAMLNNYALTTKKNMISGIMVALDVEKNKKYKEMYADILQDISNEYKKTDKQNTRSEKQKDNWIDDNDISDTFNLYLSLFNNFKHKDTLNKKNYENLLSLLILSLYTMIPPRRSKDYLDMYFYDGDSNDKTKNYYDTDGKRFIFNSFKTSQTYGTQIEEIDDGNDLLIEILDAYIRFHPVLNNKNHPNLSDIPFLVKYNGSKVNGSYVIKRLSAMFDGKTITPSLLRNVYTTYIIRPELEKVKDYAESMGTSVNKLQNVYSKEDV